jgi:hypothetical protein
VKKSHGKAFAEIALKLGIDTNQHSEELNLLKKKLVFQLSQDVDLIVMECMIYISLRQIILKSMD